jgi:hypothetical protein
VTNRTSILRGWLIPVLASLAVVAVSLGAPLFASEKVFYFGGIGLVALMAIAALAALTPGVPYRTFAAGFFGVALAHLYLATHRLTADFVPTWRLLRYVHRELRPYEQWGWRPSGDFYVHFPEVGLFSVTLLISFLAGTEMQCIANRWRRDTTPARRRWHQFTLRTLIGYTIAVALLCGWITSEHNADREQAATVAMLEAKGWDATLYPERSLFPWRYAVLGTSRDEVQQLYTHHYQPGLTAEEWERVAALSTCYRLGVSDVSYPDDPGFTLRFQHVGALSGLSELDLYLVRRITADDVACLSRLKQLDSLSLSSDEGLDLSQFPIFEQLGTLNLHGELSGGLSFLERQPNLHALELSYTTLSARDLDQIAALPNLENIRLYQVKLQSDAFPRLRHLGGLSKLTSSVSKPDDAQLAHLALCKQLKELGLREVEVGAAARHFANHEGLESLDFRRCVVDEGALARVAEVPGLLSLHFWQTPLKDDDLSFLGGSSSLNSVSVFDAPLTDEGLQSLAEIPQLRSVYLVRTRVTPEGEAAFRERRPEARIDVRDSFGEQ